MPMIKVGIVGSNALDRKGISSCIGLDKTMEVLFEADGGAHLLTQLEGVALDVVVWTFSDTFDFKEHLVVILKQLKIRVLLVDTHFSRELYLEAMETMRFGYFTRRTCIKELNKAIEKLKNKGYYYDAKLLIQWKKQSGVACDQPCFLNLLSDRQLEVAKEAILGKTSKEIGALLFISLSTVESHRSNIMILTHSNNIMEVTLFLLRYGFLSVRDLGISCLLGWMVLTYSFGTNDDWFGGDDATGTGGYEYVMPMER